MASSLLVGRNMLARDFFLALGASVVTPGEVGVDGPSDGEWPLSCACTVGPSDLALLKLI